MSTEPSTAIVVAHETPTPVVVIEADVVALARELVDRSVEIESVTAENYRAAETVTRELATFEKKLEASRKAAKAPFLEAGRRIDAAAQGLGDEVSAQKERLAKLCGDQRRREERERAEAERRQREALERAAREAEERRRADELAERELLAEAGSTADVEAVQGLAADAAVQREETAIVTLPDVPEARRSAITPQRRKRLKITDMAAIPREVGGVACMVPDEAAIGRLLRAGVHVPGCELEEYETEQVRGF